MTDNYRGWVFRNNAMRRIEGEVRWSLVGNLRQRRRLYKKLIARFPCDAVDADDARRRLLNDPQVAIFVREEFGSLWAILAWVLVKVVVSILIDYWFFTLASGAK